MALHNFFVGASQVNGSGECSEIFMSTPTSSLLPPSSSEVAHLSPGASSGRRQARGHG